MKKRKTLSLLLLLSLGALVACTPGNNVDPGTGSSSLSSSSSNSISSVSSEEEVQKTLDIVFQIKGQATSDSDSIEAGTNVTLYAKLDGNMRPGATFSLTSGSDKASLNGNTLTCSEKGDITIHASVTADGKEYVADKTYHITDHVATAPVKKVSEILSELDSIKEGEETVKYEVTGYVTSSEGYDKNYHDISFDLADEKDSTSSIKVYQYKPADVSDIDGLTKGAKVRLVATFYVYVNNSGTVRIKETKNIESLKVLEKGEVEVVTDKKVSDVLAELKGKDGKFITSKYYVTGFVTSREDYNNNSEFSNVTFYIGDSFDSGESLEVYRYKTEEDNVKDVVPGAKVKITATFVNYNGKTPETSKIDDFEILEKAPETLDYEEKSVSELLTEIKKMGSDDFSKIYMTSGYITSVKEKYTDKYNNMTFSIGDAADSSDTITIYRFKTTKDKAAKLTVGKKVKVIASFCNFKGNTPETKNIVSITPMDDAQ